MVSRVNSNETFYGVYKKAFEDFVSYKRSLGFQYGKSRIKKIQVLNRHLIDVYNPETVILTQDMVRSFMALYKGMAPQTIHNSECLIRQITLFLATNGYKDIYIYPENRIKVTTTFTPYIYTKDEIKRLFKATDNLPVKIEMNPDYRIFYQTLFRLLYCTGLRISEALNLRKEDVDLVNNVLTVNNGKENVSRLVPFNDSLHYWLLKYQQYPVENKSEYFFRPIKAKARRSNVIDRFFKNTLLPLANIAYKPDNTGPRIHDLRHTFACHALDKMIKQGMDPYCSLPYLSTYLGHKGIESAEKYLRLTEEHFKEISSATHEIYEGIGGENDE